MEIRLNQHALQRARERGASEQEIRDVLQNGVPTAAKAGRLGKARTFDYRQERQGKYYQQKRVEVIYTIEEDAIITVTVYVFYGTREGENADTL
jgi:hypothetical protein